MLFSGQIICVKNCVRKVRLFIKQDDGSSVLKLEDEVEKK